MDEIESNRRVLQEAMNFLGAISSGIEAAVGEPAKSVTYLAGEKLGKSFAEEARKTQDIDEALEEVRRVLAQHHCLWSFEAFKPKACKKLMGNGNGNETLLVFRDCMIRQSLFQFGHHQKGSLCNMMNGFFAAALETIMGSTSKLEILHAGENACLKKLIMKKNGGSAP